MKTKVTEAKEVTYAFCDSCGEAAIAVCRMCGRDICKEHRSGLGFWGEMNHCETCFRIGEPFMEQMRKVVQQTDARENEIRDEADAIVGSLREKAANEELVLMEAWKQSCLELETNGEA